MDSLAYLSGFYDPTRASHTPADSGIEEKLLQSSNCECSLFANRFRCYPSRQGTVCPLAGGRGITRGRGKKAKLAKEEEKDSLCNIMNRKVLPERVFGQIGK
ncbi:hypothetical protein chiPu_0016990 [Chiloscyllium punctatum]|uniref:Uncharacterized protein n=1 Tax=Chiloscyllium punctatum TaxID=137246 RepID=A0A401T733_CHIPU|nr:hypothetical protein [Chiloscyllium punctatum]